MSHRCAYYGRVEAIDGKIYRILRAEYGTNPETQEVKYSLDVFRECLETGICEARNVHFNSLGGWLVDFPGEKIKTYYCKESYIKELENWWETRNYTGFGYARNEEAIETVKLHILKVHPELKYLMRKILIDKDYIKCKKVDNNYNNFQYSKLFEIIRCYWKHPESETLFQLGCFDLAMNENLYKLSKPKIKAVLGCIKEMASSGELHDIKLITIQKYLNFWSKGMTFTEWYSFYRWNDEFCKYAVRYDYETYKYCLKKEISKYEYRDYIEMAESIGHDISDDYWKYPNDFRKAHDKVMEQSKAMELSKYAIQEDFLKEILKPMLKYNKQVNGYDIFISTDAKEWDNTCTTLYQCLLRNGYMKKVIMQENIIVFIWKDGIPLATAELDYKKNILQFYGDERGHANGDSCKPNEEIEKAFNVWLKDFKPKKAVFKLNPQIHYYKGFTDYDNNVFKTNVGSMDGIGKGSSFKIGEVYDTNFDDETIIKENKNCVSTNKVFHFCSSINEISKHYSPKYYAEVRPLGPVVENNGALLTNRLQIIRLIPDDEVKQLMKINDRKDKLINLVMANINV